MSPAELYGLFAELLGYPRTDLASAAERAQTLLGPGGGDAARCLTTFQATVAPLSQSEREELYARTFDLNPSRCLDLGYQIFGETYQRGSFLVKMKESVRRHGVDPGVELPDHLTVVLRLLPLLEPSEDPIELATEVILPVVEKVLRSFDDDGGGYHALLAALEHLLMSDFGVTRVEPPPVPASALVEQGGKRLPMFPGFNPPRESPWS